MGQRLVIQIKENGKIRSNCYYHWSGYTKSALPLIKKTMEELKFLLNPNKTKKDKILRYAPLFEDDLIQTLSEDGQELDPTEFDMTLLLNDDNIKLDINAFWERWIYLIAHRTTGATLSKSASKTPHGDYLPYSTQNDRSAGIIGIDYKDIQESLYWGEQITDISINDIDQEPHVDLASLFWLYKLEDHNLTEQDLTKIKNTVPYLDPQINLSYATLKDLDEIIQIVNQVITEQDGIIYYRDRLITPIY
nr:MAG TPA: hypothetical protein [Bacteriophage sp.]